MKISFNRDTLLKALKIGGYSFFGLAAFTASFFLTLPERKIAYMIENAAAKSGVRLKIGTISIGMTGSIALGEVTLQNGSTIRIDEAEISIGLLRALFRQELAGKFSARLLGGEVKKGKFSIGENSFSIEAAEITGVDLAKTGKGLPLFGTFLKGKVSGKFVLNLVRKDISAGNGYAQLAIEEGQIVKPAIKTKNYGEFTLSDIDIGKVDLEVVLDKRSNIPDLKGDRKSADGTVLYLKKAEISGVDFQARAERNSVIRLFEKKPFQEGALNLDFIFKFDDAFYEKAAGGDTPNKFLKTVFAADIKWKQAASAGFYGMICTGTVKNPFCLPKKPEIRGVEYAASKEKTGGERTKESKTVVDERKDLEKQKVIEREKPVEKPLPPEEEGATGIVNFKPDNVPQKVFPRLMSQPGVNTSQIQKVVPPSGEEGIEKPGEEHPQPVQPLEKEHEQPTEGAQVINPQESPPPLEEGQEE
ncbi:MAG: type II secretion system protein GspN [Deltaproteobacteria bacterium]|nr:type II secretion system protein GspN [Deltaproteobacteria bacterium]